MRAFLKIITLVFCLGLLVEGLCRLSGVADVPLRLANSTTGYIPKPNQSGVVLGNSWTINNLSMISEADYVAGPKTILLVGDSVVFGGNPLDQSERVGTQLEELLGTPVFSIADGSWGFKNQINYLIANQRTLRPLPRMIFVLNSKDFERPSEWRCFSTHPTERRLSATLFILRKYLFAECVVSTPPDFAVNDYETRLGVERLETAFPESEMHVLLYQSKSEWSIAKRLLEQFTKETSVDGWATCELLDYDDLWGVSMYRDNIHPNAKGAAQLAKALAECLDKR